MDCLVAFSCCVWEYLDIHEGLIFDLLIDAGLHIRLFILGEPQLSR